MGKDKESMLVAMMDMMELVHKENLIMINLLCKIARVSDDASDHFAKELENKYQEKRERWNT